MPRKCAWVEAPPAPAYDQTPYTRARARSDCLLIGPCSLSTHTPKVGESRQPTAAKVLWLRTALSALHT